MQYSQTIKNLVAGISQQPPMLRLPEQLAEQVNALSTEADGLTKRPPTCLVRNLVIPLTETSEPYVHFAVRDQYERYMMIFHEGEVSVFDLEGNRKSVTYDAPRSYITVDKPREELKCITVGDHTFIINKNVEPKMTSAMTPNYWLNQGALIHVKQGQYGRTYEIIADGKSIASYTTPDGSSADHTKQIDTTYIATQLAEKCKTSGYTAEVGQSWLHIKGDITSLKTKDGFNNQAMIGILTAVQRFNLLPNTAPKNYCVKVTGDPDGNEAGSYYVRYDEGEAVWKECARPNIEAEIDPVTMPHALVREADGTFTFKTIEWGQREAGDEDSNPLPSFIDIPFNDIFFYRNRLGLLSGENIILSESGEYFDFWMATASDVLDTDPIDIPATTSEVNILYHAVTFNGELYIFSADKQFVFSVDTVLSPKNCALVEVTSFHSSPKCTPKSAGKNLYFTTERNKYTSVKEYYNVQNIADIKNAQDISNHIPSYIPNSVYQIISGQDENILFFLTSGKRNNIYVYKYLFLEEQRMQSSFSRWEFDGSIVGGFFYGSTLYLLTVRGTLVTLEKMHFNSIEPDYEIEPYKAHLDRKVILPQGTFDPVYEVTKYSLEDIYPDTMRVGILTQEGKYIETEVDDDGVFTLQGDYSNENMIVGIPYEMTAELSPIYMKKRNQNGQMTETYTNGRLQIGELLMNYSNTGYFEVETRFIGGTTYTVRMTGKSMKGYSLGDIPNETGIFKIPIRAQNTAVTITIRSSAPLPVHLNGYEWRGTFIQKTRGV